MPEQIQEMRDQAERCRRLATAVEDEQRRQQLLDMAEALDGEAAKLEGGSASG